MSRILLPEQHLFLAVLAFFFLVSLLQLRVTWVEKLSALDLPPEGFATLAKTGEDAEQVRQQLAAGMEGVAREVGQLRQASSKAAGDAAQVLREGQEGLQQLQAEIKELKAHVRRQGEELSHQMVALARLQYDVAVVLCTLDSATKAAGGYLKARIEQEILFPYREEENQPLEAPSPLPLNVAACVTPIHDTIDARRLLEWLHFHRVLLPVDRFLLYDAGGIAGNGEAGPAHKEMQRVLAPRVKRGMVDVMWRFREVLQWDVWNYGEHLAIQDCIYWTRNAARWLLVSSIDDYLQIPPPLSLPALLQEHESLPWLTFGATAFNGSFYVYSASQCLDEEGSRRYILDPRRVITATANSVASSRPGINLPVEIARLARFPDISQSGFATCTLGEPSDSWWEKEEGVAALAEAARRCPALKPWTKWASAEVS
ncbi:unnamed protein product [Closterium sp. Yama58-4]|nr:unnamed protein product [Closterium sp. Yama58-4]